MNALAALVTAALEPSSLRKHWPFAVLDDHASISALLPLLTVRVTGPGTFGYKSGQSLEAHIMLAGEAVSTHILPPLLAELWLPPCKNLENSS